jgi:hypothetical protein
MGKHGSDGSEGSEGSEAKESERGLVDVLSIEPPTCSQEVLQDQAMIKPLSNPLNVFSF